MKTFKQSLIEQINQEINYQTQQNATQSSGYVSAAKFHTQYIDELALLGQQYPNYIDQFLVEHIRSEEAIFGGDSSLFELTDEEKGRIYSLVRCKHMMRMAKENLSE